MYGEPARSWNSVLCRVRMQHDSGGEYSMGVTCEGVDRLHAADSIRVALKQAQPPLTVLALGQCQQHHPIIFTPAGHGRPHHL